MSPATLNSLSLEIHACIIDNAPDLPTLHALICTTKMWLALFLRKPIEIIENVIKSSLPVEIQPYPRWIALLSTLKTSHSAYVGADIDTFAADYRERYPRKTPYFVPELPDIGEDCGHKIDSRQVLAAASLVQRLEDICLHVLIHNTTNAKLFRSRDRNFVFTTRIAPVQFPDALQMPLATPSPPSWIERQRVRLALWQMVASWSNHRTFLTEDNTIRDLREGGMKMVLHHTADACSGLLLGEWLWPLFRGDAFDSVHAALSTVLGCPPTSFFTRTASDHELQPAKKRCIAICESVKRFLDANSHWKVHPGPCDSDAGIIQGRSKGNLGRPNYAMGYLLTNYLKSPIGRIMHRNDLLATSQLGLAIWDNVRLGSWGLSPDLLPSVTDEGIVRRVSPPSDSESLHIWRSLLIYELERLSNDPSNWRPLPHGAQRQLALSRGREPIDGLTFPPPSSPCLCSDYFQVPHNISECWNLDNLQLLGQDPGVDIETPEMKKPAPVEYGIIDDEPPSELEKREMNLHTELSEVEEKLIDAEMRVHGARLEGRQLAVSIVSVEMRRMAADMKECRHEVAMMSRQVRKDRQAQEGERMDMDSSSDSDSDVHIE